MYFGKGNRKHVADYKSKEIYRFYKKFNLVSYDRALVSGNGKFNSDDVYAFTNDGYMYLISKSNLHKYITSCNIQGVFVNPEDAHNFNSYHNNVGFTTNPTITNGSTTVTFTVNTTIATNTILTIRGVNYIVSVGVTEGKIITLSSPYTSKTETIDISLDENKVWNDDLEYPVSESIVVDLQNIIIDKKFRLVLNQIEDSVANGKDDTTNITPRK